MVKDIEMEELEELWKIVEEKKGEAGGNRL